MGDEVAGFVFVEEDDEIHGAQGTEDIGAVLLGVHGARGAFGAADGIVAVEADDQGVALRAGEGEVVGVAPVEDVEAAVGKNKGLALGVEAIALRTHGGGVKDAGEKLGKRLRGVHAT